MSEFNRQVKRLLEVSFPGLWVEGEISNLVKHTSGHWYFSLKDEKAQVRCVMFKGHNRLTPFSPANGMQVLVKATGSIYPARGDFQLIVEHMEEAGAGALQRAFEQLKQKLLQEGLFASERKQALPVFPKHIGVISSPSGAVIRDICTVLKRRCPLIKITLLPSLVQGKEAAEQLVHRLKLAEAAFNFDALIIARGGGSLEDLQPFNDERVARAIAVCPIPVVSSIGHETDTTIADFVADYRAPTPSTAAEVLSPDQHKWAIHIKEKEVQLYQLISARLQTLQTQVIHLYKRLRHPKSRLREQAQQLDYLVSRLQQGMERQLVQHEYHLARLSQGVYQHTPGAALERSRLKLTHFFQRLQQAMEQSFTRNQHRLQATCGQLHAYSPLQTLERGYSITQKKEGILITSYHQVKADENINIQLHKGRLTCTVNTATKS